MKFDYDSFRDYYQGEDFPVRNNYFLGGVFLIMGVTGLFEYNSLLYPYGAIIQLVIALVIIAFPRFGNTWGKKRDYILIQDGVLKWSLNKEEGRIQVEQIKAVEPLVSALRFYMTDGSSEVLSTHKILSKSKFDEFTQQTIPQLKAL